MNVLLIQLKRIGDLILTVPAIAALRKDFPQAKIFLVASHSSRELLPAVPDLDEFFLARGGLTDVLQWVQLGGRQFDYCLDFCRTDRSAFFTLLSGAPRRITYDSIRRQPLRQLSYNEFVPSQVGALHTVDHHLALLAPLGVHDSSREVHLTIPPAAKARAEAIISENQLGSDFVVLHPGSARAEKFWLARQWAEVADWIHETQGMPLVITGGRSRLEQQHIGRIKRHLRHPVIDLSGKLDLLTLAALIERARLLLTIDSAPMHLAGAVGTAQVALFGPTNPFHWRPRFSPAVILRAGQLGLMRDFVPKQTPCPMKEISTASVIDAIGSLLSTPAVQAS